MSNKPKVIAYCPLHYGAEYLEAAIKAIEGFVDAIYIYYSADPSYGFFSDKPCPETEEQLFRIAIRACADKLRWFRITAGSEGAHRAMVLKDCRGADVDLILAFDADEVFDERDIGPALQAAFDSDQRYYGINGYVNFWRSFDRACFDSFQPIRITNLHNQSGQGTVDCRIYHFSCAQSEEIMRYKYEIHGHKDEIRPNWLEEVYFGWKEGDTDLHPVAHGIWNTAPFFKESLPQLLKDHPNYEKTVI